MAGVENIETAVCEDNLFPLSLQPFDLLFDLLEPFYFTAVPFHRFLHYEPEVLASTRQNTLSQPNLLSTREHSFRVLPVVATSSTRITVRPLTRLWSLSSKALLTFFRLSSLLRPVWGWVYRILLRDRKSSSVPSEEAACRASSRLWLNPLSRNRLGCKGTGIITQPSVLFSHPLVNETRSGPRESARWVLPAYLN